MVLLVQIGCDWESDSQQKEVRVVANGLLAQKASMSVPRALEIGLVSLFERCVRLHLIFRKIVDTSRPYVGDMGPCREAGIHDGECTQDIGPQSLDLVVLAPVNVGCATLTRAVDYVGGLMLFQVAIVMSARE